MTLLFKICGFSLIVLATTMIGFKKSGELKLRYKKLCNIQKGLNNLKERIRLQNGEIDRLIKLSFGEYPINSDYLENDEYDMVEEFFKNIGMSDSDSEYKRCELYISLIKTKADEALTKQNELSKLYKSMGVMGGLFICILLL